MSPAEIRAFLARHGLAPHRDLGQNFLADERLAAKLVDLAGVEPGDRVLEIGTGLGILTRALAQRAARVVSVEIDAGLVRALEADAMLPANATLVHADARVFDLAAALGEAGGRCRVVANLPYSVAAPLLRRLLDLADRLASWSVMVQREMAERLVAAPGSADYGSLAVLHAWVVSARRGTDVHARCFHPVPQVASRFLTLRPHESPELAPGELARLEPFLRAGFQHRRKTLANALHTAGAVPAVGAAVAALEAGGLDARCRAEVLDPAAWLQLARRLADSHPEQV